MLTLYEVALFAHTGAVYRSLADTTDASNGYLASEGPPIFGISLPMALAVL